MADAPKVYGGGYATGMVYGERWRTARVLGKGGQGIVYEVEDLKGEAEPPEDRAKRMKALLIGIKDSVNHMTDWKGPVEGFIAEIGRIATGTSLPRAALKMLLPFEDAVNAKTAETRLASEMAAMRQMR